MRRKPFTIVVLGAIAACAGGPRSPLEEIAKEPLQAGVGLGALKLTQTTLGAFARKYGVEQSVVTEEENAARVDFVNAGLAFLFRGDPACGQGLAAHMSAAGPESRDANKFFLENPGCENMLLESIAAYIPEHGEPLYEGETLEGVGLNAARALAERAYVRTQQAVNALEGGTELPEEKPLSPDELHYPGLRVYLGRDANGREVVRKLEVVPRQY